MKAANEAFGFCIAALQKTTLAAAEAAAQGIEAINKDEIVIHSLQEFHAMVK